MQENTQQLDVLETNASVGFTNRPIIGCYPQDCIEAMDQQSCVKIDIRLLFATTKTKGLAASHNLI